MLKSYLYNYGVNKLTFQFWKEKKLFNKKCKNFVSEKKIKIKSEEKQELNQ